MQNQKLCLKWNNHMSNMLTLLGGFQQKDMLVDVTISCQGQNIKAHKVILSACSPYFQNIFMENPCQHPIIIINGMKFEDITAILNFMYKGEVNVSQDGLSSFLQAAEALKVKGLAEVCGEKKGTNSISQEVQQSELNRPQRTDTPPRKRPRNRKRSLSDSNRSDDEALSRKHREPSSPEVHELSGDESFTGDNNSNGPAFNTISRVPQNVYSRSHQSSSNMGGEEDDEYDVELNKMQDTTDSNVSMNNTNADNNLRIERIMGNATEIESSSMAEPESPPDIKPIINFEEARAGPSESGSMMLYNEQSQPGPSNVQESSLLHDNSHAQGEATAGMDEELKRILYMCSGCHYICGLQSDIKNHTKSCTGKKIPENKGLYDALNTRVYVCPECDFYCKSEQVMKTHYKVCNRGKCSIASQTNPLELDKNLKSIASQTCESALKIPLIIVSTPCCNSCASKPKSNSLCASKPKSDPPDASKPKSDPPDASKPKNTAGVKIKKEKIKKKKVDDSEILVPSFKITNPAAPVSIIKKIAATTTSVSANSTVSSMASTAATPTSSSQSGGSGVIRKLRDFETSDPPDASKPKIGDLPDASKPKSDPSDALKPKSGPPDTSKPKSDPPDASKPKIEVSTGSEKDPLKVERIKDEIYTCMTCNYLTKSKLSYKKHCIRHTAEKRFVCSYCEKGFPVKDDLESHLRTHTGERPYICDVCNETFGSNSTLKKHKIRWHTDKRPFVCNECKSAFKLKSDLKTHSRIHNRK